MKFRYRDNMDHEFIVNWGDGMDARWCLRETSIDKAACLLFVDYPSRPARKTDCVAIRRA